MQSPSSTFSSSWGGATLAFGAGLLALQLALVHAGHPSAFFHSELTAWQYERALEIDRAQGIDVLVTGNSQLNVGFDAGLFSELSGRQAFNFALDGADALTQAAFLREILLPTFEPEVVVWGIAPRDLNANPKYASHTHREEIFAGPALRLASLPGGWRVIPFVKDLLPFHRRTWHDWARVGWHWLRDEPEPLDARGWRRRDGSYAPEPFRQVSEGYYFEALHAPEWFAQVRETADAIRARGVALRVVVAPVHANTVGFYDPAKLAEALAFIAELGGGDEPPVLDWFQDEEFADAALYHDAIHLNTRGAERFTRRMAGALGPAHELGSTASLR